MIIQELFQILNKKRYELDLEKVALEAVKIKIQEIFGGDLK